MTTSILIVSFKRDFPYLRFCFRSISRFARGFHRLHLLVPTGQGEEVNRMASDERIGMTIVVSEYEEWPDRPMVHHMRQILYSDDWAFDADFITHIDSDCVFRENVTPNDYIFDGKPYLRYERFDRLGVRHPGAGAWQEPTQRCLPFNVWAETMRSHGATFHRGLYREARACMEKQTGMSVDDYMRTVKPTYPEGVSEFNVLGNVAMHCFPDKYILVEQSGDRVAPDPKLDQLWSRGPIDQPQKIWLQGMEKEVIPIQHFASLGLT